MKEKSPESGRFIVVATKYLIAILIFFFAWAAPAGLSAYDTKSADYRVFSAELRNHFGKLGWTDLHPERIAWTWYRRSQLKRPLIYTAFGDNSEDITLMLAGVHGDENPSVYVMFRMAEFLKDNPALSRNKKIIIAPLVNPDGFFKTTQTRTNAAGVDLNRNFPTRDWRSGRKDRYYPGPIANSEAETKFQIALINHFKPTRIISVHCPLGFYDYDGPSSDIDSVMIWLKKMSRDNGLPLQRYHVFPGSLGNYAGVERKIHTLTIELPSASPRQGEAYFNRLKKTFITITDLASLSR